MKTVVGGYYRVLECCNDGQRHEELASVLQVEPPHSEARRDIEVKKLDRAVRKVGFRDRRAISQGGCDEEGNEFESESGAGGWRLNCSVHGRDLAGSKFLQSCASRSRASSSTTPHAKWCLLMKAGLVPG